MNIATEFPTTASLRFLKLRDVIEMTSLSRSTIYRKMDQNLFPRPIVITEACVRWRDRDVQEWMGRFTTKTGPSAT